MIFLNYFYNNNNNNNNNKSITIPYGQGPPAVWLGWLAVSRKGSHSLQDLCVVLPSSVSPYLYCVCTLFTLFALF